MHSQNNSNPTSRPKPELPNFVSQLPSKVHRNVFELAWMSEKLTLSARIDALDDLSQKFPYSYRKLYRSWRFRQIQSNNRVPAFINDEPIGIQIAVKRVFDTSSLESVAQLLFDLRPAIRQKEKLDAFLKEECIELGEIMQTPVLFSRPITIKMAWKAVKPRRSADKSCLKMVIDLYESIMTTEFIRLMSGHNDFGCNGKALTFVGSVSQNIISIDDEHCAFCFDMHIPAESSLVSKFNSAQNCEFTRPMEIGDVFLNIESKNYWNLYLFTINGNINCGSGDFIKVGHIHEIPMRIVDGDAENLQFKLYNVNVNCL